MSASGVAESASRPNRFAEVGKLVNQARTLMVSSLSIQESLESDSREVATSVLGGEVEDIFGEEWPLTYAGIAESVKGVVVAASIGQEDSLAETPTWPLMSAKYSFRDLEEVYESDDPVTFFAVDLLDWSEQMAQRGWPMLLKIELAYMRDGRHGEISVYADTPEARQHLADIANSHNAPSEEDIEDGESEEQTFCYQLRRGFIIDYEEADSRRIIKAELEHVR